MDLIIFGLFLFALLMIIKSSYSLGRAKERQGAVIFEKPQSEEVRLLANENTDLKYQIYGLQNELERLTKTNYAQGTATITTPRQRRHRNPLR